MDRLEEIGAVKEDRKKPEGEFKKITENILATKKPNMANWASVQFPMR